MTVALSDIVVLRNLLRPLRDLNDAPTLCKYLESFYTLRKVVDSIIIIIISTLNSHYGFLILNCLFSSAARGIDHQHVGRRPIQGL